MSVITMLVVRCTSCGRRWETDAVPERCPFCEGDCAKGQHDKEYSNLVLDSYPPQYPWVCRKCGKHGADRGTMDTPPRMPPLGAH